MMAMSLYAHQATADAQKLVVHALSDLHLDYDTALLLKACRDILDAIVRREDELIAKLAHS